MLGIVWVTFCIGVWKASHVPERNRLHGEVKSESPVGWCVFEPASSKQECRSFGALFRREQDRQQETGEPLRLLAFQLQICHRIRGLIRLRRHTL